jgi:hypothetical protein
MCNRFVQIVPDYNAKANEFSLKGMYNTIKALELLTAASWRKKFVEPLSY